VTGYEPREQIGGAACGERHNDGDVARRPGVLCVAGRDVLKDKTKRRERGDNKTHGRSP
jgi:hypothetical protein